MMKYSWCYLQDYVTLVDSYLIILTKYIQGNRSVVYIYFMQSTQANITNP